RSRGRRRLRPRCTTTRTVQVQSGATPPAAPSANDRQERLQQSCGSSVPPGPSVALTLAVESRRPRPRIALPASACQGCKAYCLHRTKTVRGVSFWTTLRSSAPVARLAWAVVPEVSRLHLQRPLVGGSESDGSV